MADIEKSLRSCLLSAARNGGRTLRELRGDYKGIFAEDIPFAQLGYPDWDSFFADLENRGVIGRTGRRNPFGEFLYAAPTDPKVAHLERQIKGQKKAKAVQSLAGNQRGRPLHPAISANRARGRGRGRGGHTQTSGRETAATHYHFQPPRMLRSVVAPTEGYRGIGRGRVSSRGSQWGPTNGGFYAPEMSRPHNSVSHSHQETSSGHVPASGDITQPSAVNTFGVQQQQPGFNPYSARNRLGLGRGLPVSTRRIGAVSPVQSRGPASSAQGPPRAVSPSPADNTRFGGSRKVNAEAPSQCSSQDSAGRRLPSIRQFADEIKFLLAKKYPSSILVTDLSSAYREEYGADFDVDTEKFYCKKWNQLVTGLFKGFCEAQGEGEAMAVRCRAEEARKVLGSSGVNVEDKENSHQAGRSQDTKERLRSICVKILPSASEGFPADQLLSRIRAVKGGKELLGDLNISSGENLISSFPEFHLHLAKAGETTVTRDNQQVTGARPKQTPLKPLAERVKDAHEFALKQPDRKISRNELESGFEITAAEFQDILLHYKALFTIKWNSMGSAELRAVTPGRAVVQEASVADDYGREVFHFDSPHNYVRVVLADKNSAEVASFNVKLADKADESRNLLDRMQVFYSELEEEEQTRWAIRDEDIRAGLPCTLLCRDFKCFRLTITGRGVTPDTANVLFVDHGLPRSNIPLRLIRKIPLMFVGDMLSQAIPCCLMGVPESSEANKVLISFFETSSGGIVWAYIHDLVGERYVVDLCEVSDRDDPTFLTELINMETASRTSHMASSSDTPASAATSSHGIDESVETVQQHTAAAEGGLLRVAQPEASTDRIAGRQKGAKGLSPAVQFTENISAGTPKSTMQKMILVLELRKQNLEARVAESSLRNTPANDVVELLTQISEFNDQISFLQGRVSDQ